MRSAVIAALLSVTVGVRVSDDYLVDAPSVDEFMDAQADLNVLGEVSKDKMESIPDDMQVTYSQAVNLINKGKKNLQVSNENTEGQEERVSVRMNHRTNERSSEHESSRHQHKHREEAEADAEDEDEQNIQVKIRSAIKKKQNDLVQTKHTIKSKVSHRVNTEEQE